MRRPTALATAFLLALAIPATAQTNPLGGPEKVRNYLPHMTRPEVEDLLTRTDMAIIPVASLEQHGTHLPIGTDYLNGEERAKLIAQRADVLVAPILFPGQSPYHMEFAGTVTLPSSLIQEVYVESVKSLIRHGFKRFLILNAHGGNNATSTFIVDRINQETAGIAVKLNDVVGPFMARGASRTLPRDEPLLDRHGGTGETAQSMYLIPELVDLAGVQAATLSMPPHLEGMVPDVLDGDPTATAVFLAEGLKDAATGKGTSAAQMSSTGVWGAVDPSEASLERGRVSAEAFVDAAVAFIHRWNELRPPQQVYDPEARLSELGITLPEPPNPVANYVNGVQTGNLIFLAGKGPRRADGTEITGKLGADVTIDEGYEAARLTAINQLAVLKDMLGDLSRVVRVVKVLGMVNSAPDFVEQPAVINGFSDLIVEVFGDRGRHARAAVGMVSLPRGQAVEIELVVEVR